MGAAGDQGRTADHPYRSEACDDPPIEPVYPGRTYVLHRSIVHARPANPIIHGVHTYVSHVGWRNEQGDVRTSSENYDGGDGSDDPAFNARQSLLQLRNSLLFRLCRSFVCTPRDFVIFVGRHTQFSWT